MLSRPLAVLALLAALLAPARAGAAQAWVTNQGDGTVTLLDTDQGAALATIPVGGEPAGIAVSPDGQAVFVTCPGTNEVVRLDPATRAVTTRRVAGKGAVGIDTDGARVFVADWYGGRLMVLDAKTLATMGEVALGPIPAGVVLVPGRAVALVAVRDADAVAVVDLDTLTVARTIPVGVHPFGIGVDAKGDRAYVANVVSDDVSVLDLATGKEVKRVPVASHPYSVAVTPDGSKAYATNQQGNSVSVIDTATLTVTATIPVGDYPEGVMADPDGTRVYVASWFDNELGVIDTATNTVKARLPTGDGPRAFGRFLLP